MPPCRAMPSGCAPPSSMSSLSSCWSARRWRPVLAAAGMAPAVLAPQLFWAEPQTLAGWGGLLAIGVAAGSLLYPAFILLFWRLAGRPDSAEKHVLAWLGEKLGPRLARGS